MIFFIGAVARSAFFQAVRRNRQRYIFAFPRSKSRIFDLTLTKLKRFETGSSARIIGACAYLLVHFLRHYGPEKAPAPFCIMAFLIDLAVKVSYPAGFQGYP